MTYDPGSPGALSYLEAAREMAAAGPHLDTTADEGAAMSRSPSSDAAWAEASGR